MPRSSSVPRYRHHKATGRAVVTLAGRHVYLGPFGSPESQAEYARVIAEFLAGGSVRPARNYTVAELVDAHRRWAEAHYRNPDGRLSTQVSRLAQAVKPLLALYAATPAAKFGPLALKACREQMLQKGWGRVYTNQCVGCLRRLFAWGVSEELIPPAVDHGLRAVATLKAHRTAAPEPRTVLPVPEPDLEATLPHLPPPVRALVELQLWTGMRPGEAAQLTPGCVSRTGEVTGLGAALKLPRVWVYQPRRHKQLHRGRPRVVLLGPAAQELLAPWLERDPDRPCFSPRETVAWVAATYGRALPDAPERPAGLAYTADSYRRAVEYGIAKANRHGAAVGHWHPHQLRHNAATRLAARHGPQVARVLLGHSTLDATRIYAEDDLVRAAMAAFADC